MFPESESLILGMMTKYWQAGRVKTRLGAAIGMHRSAALHKLFVAHLCESLSHIADQRIVCLSPDHRLDRFQLALQSWGLNARWDTMPQGGGSLGERMQHWFTQTLDDKSSSHGSRAILIGADCPLLDADTILKAGELLRKRDVVLGPAADGGYYLIGVRGPWQRRQARFETLFRDIPWSTKQVLPLTRERLCQAQLSFTELETREDIDTLPELNRLRDSLHAGTRERDDILITQIERIMADQSEPSAR